MKMLKDTYDEMVKAYGDAVWLIGSSNHTSKSELIKMFGKAEDLALEYMDRYEAFDTKDERYNFANYISNNSHKEINKLLWNKKEAAERRQE